MSYEFKIEEYNPEWKEWFILLRAYFFEQLANLIIDIEHIGSTSVPKMAAKPIIDMDIVIEERNFEPVKKKLEELGYLHQGDLGIQEREAFKLLNQELKSILPPHHLYVCNEESRELHRHKKFRDFLIQNPKYRDCYSKIKKDLYIKYPENREAYIEEKDEIVSKIVRKALENA